MYRQQVNKEAVMMESKATEHVNTDGHTKGGLPLR